MVAKNTQNLCFERHFAPFIVFLSVVLLAACHAGEIGTGAGASNAGGAGGGSGQTPDPNKVAPQPGTCVSAPCGDNGTCTDVDGGYTCACNADFVFSNGTCTSAPTPAGPCDATPCGPGTCMASGATYSCECPTGFEPITGTCKPLPGNMNPCASNPCGVGTCAGSGATYTCTCPATHEVKNGTCVLKPVDPCAAANYVCKAEITCTLQPLNCPAASWPSGFDTFENQVVALVNAKRAAGATCPAPTGGSATVFPPGAVALIRNATIDMAARFFAFDLANRDYYSADHKTLPPESWSPWDRMRFAGFYVRNTTPDQYPKGEAVMYGTPTAQEAVDWWMASPSHCPILMNPKSTVVGVGYAHFDNVATMWNYYVVFDTGCAGTYAFCN